MVMGSEGMGTRQALPAECGRPVGGAYEPLGAVAIPKGSKKFDLLAGRKNSAGLDQGVQNRVFLQRR